MEAITNEAWVTAVEAAMRAQDAARLGSLYDEAVAALGREGASQAWLAVVSALDGTAITG